MTRYALKDICTELHSGKGISSSEISDAGKYPVIGGNGVRGYTTKSNFSGECAVIGRQGAACGNVRFFSGDAYMTEHAVMARGNSICDSRYLAYALGQMHLGRLSAQSAQPGLSVKTLGEQVIELPAHEEQEAIVDVLGKLDDKIALNSQINGYLAALLDASYSLATENGAEVKTLPEVVDIFSGGTPKTGNPEYWEGGNIPFFAPGDVTRSVYALTTEKHITEMGLANCNSSLYPIDTVFLTARGTVGKVAIAGNPMAMNQSCFAFRGKDIPQSVVFQIIKHAVKSLKAKANGATFAAINTRDLGIERVAIPSKDAMHAYDRDASVWLSEILTNEKENLRLANLRDALLPKLMSGEIDASKVDLTQLNSHLSGC